MKIRTTVAAATGVLALVASGPSVAVAGAQAPESAAQKAPRIGKVVVTPSTGLANLQTVTVKVSNFGKYTGKVAVAQCTTGVLAGVPAAQACDVRKKHVTRGTITNGKGTLKFKVRVGKSFTPGSSTQKCNRGGSCIVTVSTSTNPVKYAGFDRISFKR